MHGARLKYLRNGFTMLEMAYRFGKSMGNGSNMWGNDLII